MMSAPLDATGLPPVTRAFVDTEDGQLHVRRAGTHRPGATPLFIFHQSPNSSRTFEKILPFLGQGRLAVAVDTPGFGESFRPTAAPSIVDYVHWLAKVPTALGFDRFDVMGQFTGAGTASQMAVAYPNRVRRVVLAGPPLFTPAQQRGFVENAWPMVPREDGGHLMFEWGRIIGRSAPDLSIDAKLDTFVDFYRGGGNAIWGEQAIATFPLREVLPKIKQRTLVIKPQGIHGDAAGAAALLNEGEMSEIDISGYGMMSAGAERVAALISSFLDHER